MTMLLQLREGEREHIVSEKKMMTMTAVNPMICRMIRGATMRTKGQKTNVTPMELLKRVTMQTPMKRKKNSTRGKTWQMWRTLNRRAWTVSSQRRWAAWAVRRAAPGRRRRRSRRRRRRPRPPRPTPPTPRPSRPSRSAPPSTPPTSASSAIKPSPGSLISRNMNRPIRIRCRSGVSFARACSSTSALATATSSCTPGTASTAVHTANLPSPGATT